MKIIYTEDTYAQEAISALVAKLKELGTLNPREKVKAKPIPGLCSAKFSRVLAAAAAIYDKVVVLIDGDGNPEATKKREEQHLPAKQELRRKVAILVNKYEIEEWILHAKNTKPHPKPSKELPKLIGRNYEKSDLPKLLRKILDNQDELQRLLSHSTVQELVKQLSDPKTEG